MLLSTMALIACVGFTSDVICSRITSHLYWLADAVLILVTFAHQAHDAFSFCHFAAYYCATSLGEAWPPVAAGSFHFDGPTVSGQSIGLHSCLPALCILQAWLICRPMLFITMPMWPVLPCLHSCLLFLACVGCTASTAPSPSTSMWLLPGLPSRDYVLRSSAYFGRGMLCSCPASRFTSRHLLGHASLLSCAFLADSQRRALLVNYNYHWVKLLLSHSGVLLA